jgi:hypothetical protein
MDIIMWMFALLVLWLLSWLAAQVAALHSIHKAQTADQMIHIMLTDTYAMMMVGVIMWVLLPSFGHVFLAFLSVRAYILLRINWEVIHEEFDFIKSKINKKG